jgi:hypothetical protein
MSFHYSPRIVQDGLVLYLDAANTKSYPTTGTTWTDLSRSGNNGTLTNGPTFNSSNGGSIVFDGVDDYVSMIEKNPPTINSTFPNGLSILFTIKLANPFPSTIDGRTIITRNSNNTGTNAFNLSIQSNRKIRFWINSLSNVPFSNTVLNVDQIYIGVITWDRSTAKFFLQGNLDSSTSYTPSPSPSSLTNFNVGYWGTTGWQFPGSIYSILFYNRALSATEVLQNYNATKSRFGL